MHNDPRRVLIVAESRRSVSALLAALARRGVFASVARRLDAGLRRLARGAWSLVVADAAVLGEKVAEDLGRLREAAPATPAALIGVRRVEDAAAAVRCGCVDVRSEGLSADAAEDLLERHLVEEDPSGGIVGSSRAIRDALDKARRVASSSLPVLICGESGTGKELLSAFLHSHSPRAGGPFVQVNCAALSESLLESELFGHERGAFTGAVRRHQGRFERAHGGTLLLDEITETQPRLQAELLRVLETRDFQRVGGQETLRADVRLVSTTNRDLRSDVEAGRFRRDLYYRISGVRITVPPLRERVEDIPELVHHFVRRHAHEAGRTIESIDPATLELLQRAAWPGNVRQLRNVIRAALALGSGETLSLDGADELVAELNAARLCPARSETLQLQELERRAVLEAMRRTNDHQQKAARLLGITDRTLREKLRRYRRRIDDRRNPDAAKETDPCLETPA